MGISDYRLDCIHFSGWQPCKFHKLHLDTCVKCTSYKPEAYRVLIIKTGAAGDVIRTTPILRKLHELHENISITWITNYPEFLPAEAVNKTLLFNSQNCLTLIGQKFNLVINLDKSLPEANLLNLVKYDELMGFKLTEMGKIIPANEAAYKKWLTGINDVEMKKSKKHFVEELFEICGWKFSGEKYWLNTSGSRVSNVNFSERKTIGLNTGCGERWLTRLWPVHHFIELCHMLIDQGYNVVLLGGEAEHDKNREIAIKTGAHYYGVRPLLEFVGVVASCDLILTSVTMALHIGIALEKRIVLLNNIFPKNEFYLYELGEILEPGLSCQSCFKNAFDSSCQKVECLQLITPEKAYSEIIKQLS